jgi:hypothetical protein
MDATDHEAGRPGGSVDIDRRDRTDADPTVAAAAHRAVVKVVAVKTGLNGPSAFTFTHGGTIWYLERGTGEVHTLNPSTGGDHLVFTIPGVDGSGERGALGIALHPNWRAKQQVFVYVTRSHAGHMQNQLVRFSVNSGSGSNLRTLGHTGKRGSVSQRRAHPVRTGSQAVRGDRGRAQRGERAGSDEQPARQDPAAGYRRDGRPRQSARSHLVLRPP